MHRWLKCYFSDPEAISIVVTLLIGAMAFTWFGNVLVPILISVVLAYMLSGFVKRLQRWKCPSILAVTFVYLLFIGALIVFFVWLLPLIFQQLSNLFVEIPIMLNHAQTFLVTVQQHHPEYFSAEQLRHFVGEFSRYFTKFGRYVLSLSLVGISNIITIIVYAVLVPLLVFFFLKDGKELTNWLGSFLPHKHDTISRILNEVDNKIGNYIRGKIIEMVIVAVVSMLAFALLGLNYAILLGAGVGLSVLIPYVGAVVITVPVLVIAALQWGWSAAFAYLIIVYTIIVILDANLLVPLIFSEKMKLHPVAILLSVLIFGALWGFWGVFFAIPLMTLVDVLIREWPRNIEESE